MKNILLVLCFFTLLTANVGLRTVFSTAQASAATQTSQSFKPKFKIFTIRGKVTSFDKKNVTLDVDGKPAHVLREAFPLSQRLIYNEMATAYYKLRVE